MFLRAAARSGFSLVFPWTWLLACSADIMSESASSLPSDSDYFRNSVVFDRVSCGGYIICSPKFPASFYFACSPLPVFENCPFELAASCTFEEFFIIFDVRFERPDLFAETVCWDETGDGTI